MGMYNTGLSFISTESEVILLYVKKAMVTGISLNPSVTKDQIIPVRQLKTAVGVDVSVEDQYLFWSDITADSISRVFFNGSGRETVVSDGELFTLPDLTNSTSITLLTLFRECYSLVSYSVSVLF